MENKEIEKNRKKLLELLEKIKGKTIKDIDTTGLLGNANNKGEIGQVIQKYLGKDLDSDPGMDFPEANLELKVTGLLPYSSEKKDAYRAKERLVLTNINYNEDCGKSFEESHLIEKCNAMLMTCYEYIAPKKGEKPDYGKFPVVDSFILSFSDEDKALLESDYDRIMLKVKEGHAELISESDTLYLSACTKGKDSSVLKSQPYSSVKAKPRAFALKQAFLSTLIRQYISNEKFERIVGGNGKTVNLETFVLEKIGKWYGKTEAELGEELGVSTRAKNRYSMYVSRIFKVGDIEASEEFQKADIKVKTIRMEKKGRFKENISFPAMDFNYVSKTPWEESDIRAEFMERKFPFVIFKKSDKGYVLDKAFFYNFKDDIVDEFIGYTYKKTQDILNNGAIVNHIQNRMVKGKPKNVHHNNFVGQKENQICHVRPHAKDFYDQDSLPVPDRLTGYTKYEKQCFWISTAFIRSILENREEQFVEEARKRLKR